MLDAALHVTDLPAGIAFVPGAIEVLGRRPELHDEIAGEVLRLGLAPFLAPEADQGGFIAAHDDPGVRAAYKRPALDKFAKLHCIRKHFAYSRFVETSGLTVRCYISHGLLFLAQMLEKIAHLVKRYESNNSPRACFRWHNSVQPVRFSAGARRILPRRLKSALQPFGVLKAKKGRSPATFQLWSKFRRHSNTPESNSSTMTSWAASAFGWQRRKESDDVKPLVSTKIFCSISSNARSSRADYGASAEVHWLRGHQHPHSRPNGNHVAALTARSTSRSQPRSTPLSARTTAPAISTTIDAGPLADAPAALTSRIAGTTGTNMGGCSAGRASRPARAALRQANRCCGVIIMPTRDFR